jgi:glycosyltransferase involved in cell wall biosynthesis
MSVAGDKTSESRQKLVIVDAVCGKRTGHNLPTLAKYRSFFEERGIEVVATHVASTFHGEPEHCITDLEFNFAPFFDPEMSSSSHRRAKKLARGLGRGIIQESTRFFFAYPFLHRQAKKSAIRDLVRLLNRYPDTTLFYPGADFYVIWAVRSLARTGALKGKHISLRLMGVMETAGYLPLPQKVLPWLMRDIACTAQDAVVFSAETEKYARVIEGWTQAKVPVTSIPSFSLSLPANRQKHETRGAVTAGTPLLLGFLGGARADKGYGELPGIAHRLCAQFGLRVKCLVQTMSPHELYYSKADNEALAKWPNVALLPSNLSDESLMKHIAECDALVLPYSLGTYEFRGSAMLFDALSLGVPVIGRAGTGFGESIDSHGLGRTFSTVDELVVHIADILSSLADERTKPKWAEAASTYLESLENSLIASVSPNEEVLYLH